MIRAILGLHRNPDLGLLEFRERTEGVIEPFLRRYREASGATGFKVHHPLLVWENVRFQSIWGGTEPFDLLIEFWWEDGAACREGTQRQEAMALVQGLQGSQSLIDASQSTLTYLQD